MTTAAVTAALPARLSRARTSGDTTPRDNSSNSSNNNTCYRITADNTVNRSAGEMKPPTDLHSDYLQPPEVSH